MNIFFLNLYSLTEILLPGILFSADRSKIFTDLGGEGFSGFSINAVTVMMVF